MSRRPARRTLDFVPESILEQNVRDVLSYHYVAYIDEAGDDSLTAVKPLVENGSSEWLILSAVVIRATHQQNVPKWVSEVTGKIKGHQASALHFKNLNPTNKAMACETLATFPARYFIVAANKKNMMGYYNPDAAQIPSDNWFYCWMTRVLLERVTRFVHRRLSVDNIAAGKLRLEYSARGGLRYAQMHAYYEWLKTQGRNPFLKWGRLYWEVMHPHLFYVYPHLDREGLQLADVVASAFFKACDRYDTGACDPTFAKLLRPRMAQAEKGQIAGYGVKLLPSLTKAKLDPEQADIFKYYGYPSQWWDPEAFS